MLALTSRLCMHVSPEASSGTHYLHMSTRLALCTSIRAPGGACRCDSAPVIPGGGQLLAHMLRRRCCSGPQMQPGHLTQAGPGGHYTTCARAHGQAAAHCSGWQQHRVVCVSSQSSLIQAYGRLAHVRQGHPRDHFQVMTKRLPPVMQPLSRRLYGVECSLHGSRS